MSNSGHVFFVFAATGAAHFGDIWVVTGSTKHGRLFTVSCAFVDGSRCVHGCRPLESGWRERQEEGMVGMIRLCAQQNDTARQTNCCKPNGHPSEDSGVSFKSLPVV